MQESGAPKRTLLFRPVIALVLAVSAFCGCDEKETGEGRRPLDNAVRADRLPRHPVLKMPLSKRPFVKFDDLKFATHELSGKANAFYRATENLNTLPHVVGFRDVRYSNSPVYRGIWATTDNHSRLYYRADIRPYREFRLEFAGESERAVDQALDKLSARGIWIPSEGWAAMVLFSIDDSSGQSWSGQIGEVQSNSNSFEFFTYNKAIIPLILDRVSVVVPVGDGLAVEYASQNPVDFLTRNNARFVALFDSAESMRDTMQNEIDDLEKIANSEIANGTNISVHAVVEWDGDPTNEPPPREVPANLKTPNEQAKQKLLVAVKERLQERRKRIDENYENIFEAINRAMPGDTVREVGKH